MGIGISFKNSDVSFMACLCCVKTDSNKERKVGKKRISVNSLSCKPTQGVLATFLVLESYLVFTVPPLYVRRTKWKPANRKHYGCTSATVVPHSYIFVYPLIELPRRHSQNQPTKFIVYTCSSYLNRNKENVESETFNMACLMISDSPRFFTDLKNEFSQFA